MMHVIKQQTLYRSFFMDNNYTLTEAQRQEIHSLEFCYRKGFGDRIPMSGTELYKRVLALDNSLKKSARVKAVTTGLTGLLLFISGYNLLTRLEHSFLIGILFFSFGSVLLAGAYPIYNILLGRSRNKYAPVVLTVTGYLS